MWSNDYLLYEYCGDNFTTFGLINNNNMCYTDEIKNYEDGITILKSSPKDYQGKSSNFFDYHNRYMLSATLMATHLW